MLNWSKENMGCVKPSKPWVQIHEGHMARFIVQLQATEKTIRVQNLDIEDVWFISGSTTQTFNLILSKQLILS